MSVTISDQVLSHFTSSPGRAVAFRPDEGDGPETMTRDLPMKYEAVVTHDDAFRVALIIDVFAEGSDLRVGVRRLEVEPIDGALSGERARRVPIQDLLLDAVRSLSINSDTSEVVPRLVEVRWRSPA